MKPLVDDNSILFDQSTSLSADALCKTSVVQFLQLNYLVAPTVITCEPWRAVAPPLDVDRWLTVHAANASDMRVRALPSQAISEAMRRLPAFGSGSSLLSALSPLPDTSVTIGPRDVVIRQARSSSAAGLTMVLPVAFDSAWTVSSGRLEKVGGLLALTGADQTRVVLSYSPDVVSMLRAMATDLSQLLTCLGLIGLAFVAPTTMIIARP